MNHRIVALIQARMGSKRLPGKVLKKIGGKTVVQIIYERLKSAKEIGDIVLAIPQSKENDVLAFEGKKIGVKTFRFGGNENDMISRYLGALEYAGGADAMLRVTADCVFADPSIAEQLISLYRKKFKQYDYFTNICPPSFPEGLDLEIFPMKTLKKLDKELKTMHDREWFSLYVRENPQKFRIFNLTAPKAYAHIRVVVDFPEDFALAKKVYSILSLKKRIFLMRDIVDLYLKKPTLFTINKKYVGYESKPL